MRGEGEEGLTRPRSTVSTARDRILFRFLQNMPLHQLIEDIMRLSCVPES